MSDEIEDTMAKDMQPIGGTIVAPAHGIAAIALNMALKYHDMTMVKDGVMYQQYKMEGKNFREMHLDIVFETAIAMEMHLLASSERIAKIVVDAIAIHVEDDPSEDAEAAGNNASGPDSAA